MKTDKVNYYSLDKIQKKNTQYKVIFGKRSNGKTYAVFFCGTAKFGRERISESEFIDNTYHFSGASGENFRMVRVAVFVIWFQLRPGVVSPSRRVVE